MHWVEDRQHSGEGESSAAAQALRRLMVLWPKDVALRSLLQWCLLRFADVLTYKYTGSRGSATSTRCEEPQSPKRAWFLRCGGRLLGLQAAAYVLASDHASARDVPTSGVLHCNISQSVVTTLRGTNAASIAARFSHVVNAVDDFAADPTGMTDTTAVAQQAIAAGMGGDVIFPPGNYQLSNTLVVASATRLHGHGARFFTKMPSGFQFIINTNLSTYETANAGYSSVFDHDIVVEGFTFDYGTLNQGGTHAVSFRFATNCIVQNCFFLGGNDGTALLACVHVTVRKCVATGCTNVAYDNWDGCENILIEDNVAVMPTPTSTGTNTGIMFTGSSTAAGSTARVTKGCVARGNKIYNAGVGIFVNALDKASTTRRCVISDNEIYNSLAGVYLTGAGFGHVVQNTYIEGGGGIGAGGCAVRIAGEPNGIAAPLACSISNTTISEFIAGTANTAIMVMSGFGHCFGRLALLNGSGIVNGTVYYNNQPDSVCSIRDDQFLDQTSIASITYGLWHGCNASPSDTNALIDCFDGFSGKRRVQGPPTSLGTMTSGAVRPTGYFCIYDSTGTMRSVPCA